MCFDFFKNRISYSINDIPNAAAMTENNTEIPLPSENNQNANAKENAMEMAIKITWNVLRDIAGNRIYFGKRWQK
jgi:hypothetical protein